MKTFKRMVAFVLSIILSLTCVAVPALALDDTNVDRKSTEDFNRMIEYMKAADEFRVEHLNGAIVYIGVFTEAPVATSADGNSNNTDSTYYGWTNNGQLQSYGSDNVIITCDGSRPYCTVTVHNTSDPLTPSGNDPVLYTGVSFTLNGAYTSFPETLKPNKYVQYAIDNSANGTNLSMTINVDLSAGILAPVTWSVLGGMHLPS